MRSPPFQTLLLLAAVLLARPGRATPAPEPAPAPVEDVWEGRIDLGGGTGLRFVLHVRVPKDGPVTATADSPDQGATGLKVDSIAIDQVALEFAMKARGAEFSGTLNGPRTEAAGEFRQGGKAFPLTLKKRAPAQVEVWEGMLKVDDGVALRLVLTVTRAQDGPLRATFASPDQGPGDREVDTISRDKDALRFEVKRIGGAFSGPMNPAGTEAAGHWKQNGNTFPLTLRKRDKATEVRRPQTPKPPFPYHVVPVTYENKAGGVTLAGTLTTPNGAGPFPAVLLISGSGPQDRDETVFGHKPFLVLADDLTRRGIAVLRVDDRGVGQSSGQVATATGEDFAGDVLAGVAYLKSRPEIDPTKIGLIGHSEGGIIAPMVAARSREVAFLVLMAGPGLPGAEILRMQVGLILKARGAKQDEVARKLGAQTRLIEVARTETDEKAATAKMRSILDELAKASPEDERAVLVALDTQIQAQLAGLRSRWFRFFLSFDPRPTLAQVHCPVLAINGEKDLQVPPEVNLAAIEKAVRGGGNDRVTVKTLPGLNHLLQTSRTGAPSEYATIEETIAPAALRLIGDWIEAQVEKASSP